MSRRWLATGLSSEKVVRGEVTIEEKVLIDLRGLVIIILLISRIVISHSRSFLFFFFPAINTTRCLILDGALEGTRKGSQLHAEASG